MTAKQPVDKRKGLTPYLFQRRKGGTWYCRVAVAPSIRHLFNGKRNLVRSLKTKNLAHAKLLRDDAVAALKKMLRDAKAANPENARAVVAEAQLKAMQEKWLRRKTGTMGPLGFAEPLTAKEEAEFRADRLLAAALGSQKVAESLGMPTFEKVKTPLNHLEDEWFAAADLTNRTKIHYRHCRELLAQHLRREGLPEAIESVNSKVALSFRKYLVKQETHVTTGNSYLGGLRSRWAMLIEEELIDPPNPFTGISLKASSRGKEKDRLPYNASELVTLFTGEVDQSLFDMMSLALCGALRRGEMVPRLVRDLEADWLIVRYGKSESSVRRVPVASILRAGMKRLIKGKAPDDFLIDFRGTTIDAKKNNVTEDMTDYLRNVAKITDPKKDGLHVLRHNWESTALEQGIQWHVTQAVIGHAMEGGHAVTAGYAHLNLLDKPKREAIEAVVKALPPQVKKAITSRFGK